MQSSGQEAPVRRTYAHADSSSFFTTEPHQYIGYRSITTRDEPTAWATAAHRGAIIIMKATKKKPTKTQLLERGMQTHYLLTTSDALEAEELEKQLHQGTKGLDWGVRVNQKVGGVSSIKQAINSSKPGMSFQVYVSSFPNGLPDDMELVIPPNVGPPSSQLITDFMKC